MTKGGQRIERDSLGEVRLDAGALYGAQTQRALGNFQVSGFTLRECPQLVRALVRVKIAAARANRDLGELDPDVADAIVRSGREVIDGQWEDQFPLDIVQGGGGTATNMNVNEVLANRAAELLGGPRGAYDRVHPNDHVNRSQSTNDVYPTAVQIAVLASGQETLSDFKHLALTLEEKATEYRDEERLGRTCLQDALPLPVSAGHRAQAHAVSRTSEDLRRALDGLRRVPLGATAVGTGFGAPTGYTETVLPYLGEEVGFELEAAPDPYDALANADPFVAVSSELARVMLVVSKIAADLRFLSSGPIGGIGELTFPSVQVGSSVMPGKVNPVIPELVMQVSYEVRGAAATIEAAVAAGELELNVMQPVIAKHLLRSLVDAGNAARLFADRCISGLRWNEDRLEENLEGSRKASVEDAMQRGYEAAARSLERD